MAAMIIIDSALKKAEESGRPIRVALVGAGYMASGIALQLLRTPGIRLVAISNRNVHRAGSVYAANRERCIAVHSVRDRRPIYEDGIRASYGTSATIEAAITNGTYVVTNNPFWLTASPSVDVIVEATGHVEFSSHVVTDAIYNRKHVVLMNAELDGTVGPILKKHADAAGVVLTNSDGDQPGVIMNLYRFVKGLGIKPVLCGNIKGFHYRYRTPIDAQIWADKQGQSAEMVTSFTDGTKVSFEQAIVANATGMRVAQRGMFGANVKTGTPISDAVYWYPQSHLLSGNGIVDYVVGAAPSPGVFVIGHCTDPVQQKYLDYYKMGSGPFYVFYTPYHLCHLEVPNTVARAALFHDAACTPIEHAVDVIAAAKMNLAAGTVLDSFGNYNTYGLCENADVVARERLLPIGLVEGCTLLRDIKIDEPLTYGDVTLPENRLCDALRTQQNRTFHAQNY